MSKNKGQTLQYVASVVFALTGVLPLLMFTYTLVRLNGLRDLPDQITLIVALMAALTGFGILRSMVTRTSRLLYAVGQATEQGDVPASAAAKNLKVPGVGPIQEFHTVAETLWPGWRARAEPYLGQRVLVSVNNASRPIAGTVLEVTTDGVLLDEDGRQVGVSYRRISAIEADRRSGGLAEADRSPYRSQPGRL